MKKATFRIGNRAKAAFRSSPYDASKGFQTPYSDGLRPIEWAVKAWLDTGHSIPLSPLLVGVPGVSTHRLVIELARRTNQKLYILQGHEDVSSEDLACAVRFSDGDSRSLEYVMSPLATAMLTGGICFIDQLPRIRPRALALLVSVLDERRSLESTLLGERIEAKDTFRFIASTTTTEVNALPDFIRSRMGPFIGVGGWQAETDHKERYVAGPDVSLDHPELLKTVWELLCKIRESGRVPSADDAIRIFALAASLGDFDNQGQPQLPSQEARSPLQVKESHLKVAFEELFGSAGPR